MTAQFTHHGTLHRCSIGREQRSDGTVGPPYRLTLTERACASADVKAWDLELDLVDPELDLAVYRVVEMELP
jgi:hypothetical protein